MAEYIDRDKAFDAVDERIDELKGDKEFNIVKEICISGVKKHIASIPTTNVVEIPEGATNGDMIKAVFPYVNFGTLAQDDVIVNKDYSNNDEPQVFIPIRIWNSPYKREVEE